MICVVAPRVRSQGAGTVEARERLLRAEGQRQAALGFCFGMEGSAAGRVGGRLL